MRVYLRTALGIALFLPTLASAQAIGNTAPFTISMDPQYPAPYSQPTLTFISSTISLANATMDVSVGGKSIYKGSVQTIPITVGGAGNVTTVKVTIFTNSTSFSQTLTIRPQDVALIVEPIASTPPLYPGKALVPLEGSARLVAMANFKTANGKTIDPATLSYSWTVDDTKLGNSSGIGKSAIIVASPLQYRVRSVSVSVTSRDETLASGASLSLVGNAPSVRIYENDPLLGVLFNHALSGSFSVSGAESTLFAAPFSLPTTNGTPAIQWFLAGTPAQAGNSITLRPTGSGQGSATVSVVAASSDSAKASATLPITFGAKGSNLFGL